ncbi:glycosyltransferase involved in cell wall biosynthesis [Thermoflavifilum aggregans]|uniref:Glycosyltransferase involved in cell wall biosynthesis n=2 Tax=Thermoflavifilum aggregans TaxID=454188 RepID=A0A2M9CTU8_9BACT|nr:glycosyltransferase involved in cell wall biosynthesis [Thermoflavifilum aggregans]
MAASSRKVMIIINDDQFFCSHFLPLFSRVFHDQSCCVYVISRDNGYRKTIEQAGFTFISVAVRRGKGDIWHNVLFFLQLIRLYVVYKPDVVLLISLKIIVFGSLAAFFSPSLRVLNYFSGLGHVFLLPENHWMRRIIHWLLWFIGKRKNNWYLFETKDDQQLIYHIIQSSYDHYLVMHGLGVPLQEFKFTELPDQHPMIVLFPARIISTKGLFELHQLAKNFQQEWQGRIKFLLAGKIDPYNPAYIDPQKLHELLIPGYLEWLGYVQDMATCYAQADVVILLSYREGVPRVLMEACAAGRPIVTFDVPGCRECVWEGKNGFLIPFGDMAALHEKINLIASDPQLRKAMGACSRQIAEENFDIEDATKRWKALLGKFLPGGV